MQLGRLRVVSGPAESAEIPIGDELVFGRGTHGGGSLGGDPELSRLHARIGRTPEGILFLEDLGSTNGTFLNGWRVNVAQQLQVGDQIAVGQTVLELVVSQQGDDASSG
jgi:pSer/pThr/pTyr-binding forkhead associated (FHA) protein